MVNRLKIFNGVNMYQYRVWVKLNQYQTADVVVNANNDWECKMLAESMYGSGMVLNYSRIN
jgi:hypothetical protein